MTEPLDLVTQALEKFDIQILAWQSAGMNYAHIKSEHLAAVAAEVKRLRAQVAAVHALADDMDTWASPYGISLTYAGRIRDALTNPSPSEDT